MFVSQCTGHVNCNRTGQLVVDFQCEKYHPEKRQTDDVRWTEQSENSMFTVIDGELFMTQKKQCLPEGFVHFVPLCDDTYTTKLSNIVKIVEQLRKKKESQPDSKLVYSVGHGPHAMKKAIFYLGSYMILNYSMSASNVSDCFEWANEIHNEHLDCEDVHNLGPSIGDCWRGLERVRILGWVTMPQSDEYEEYWGELNVNEYLHYDSASNGGLHEVAPASLILVNGPADVAGAEYLDQAGMRTFSPDFLAALLHEEFGVSVLVAAGGPHYDTAAFDEWGVHHYRLPDGCGAWPGLPAVRAFLAHADAAAEVGGVVAVHGEPWAGALAGMWLMCRRGFSAREAVGWLQLARPGSAKDGDRAFLEMVEELELEADGE